MKVYLNSEGAILQTVPSVIPRGSTVTDFEVEAPFSAAIMAVRFTLRTGTTDPLILPRVSAVSSPGLNLWSAKLEAAITEFSGNVPYSIEVRDVDGYMIASPGGTLTISPGATPTIPEAPPKNAWDAIRDYLNQIVANSNEVSQDVRDALQWIEKFENLKGISLTEDGGAIRVYKLIQSGDLDALLAMLKAYQNGNLGGGSGTPGADGFSPIAKVEQSNDGAKITITDKNGTTEAVINNGKDGAPGAQGADGKSPTIELTPTDTGVELSVTSPNGDISGVIIYNGKDGAPGADAISPVVGISAVTGGHRVSITDVNGEQYFDVMNGTDGADGADGAPGSPGADGKSAYAYAQEGGYTGTEEEFAGKLAAGSLQVEFASTGVTDDELLLLFSANKSVSYCVEAFQNGVPVYGAVDPAGNACVGVMVTCLDDMAVFEVANSINVAKRYMIVGVNDGENDMWYGTYSDGASIADIPTDEHINSLIDAKLGGIENGSY